MKEITGTVKELALKTGFHLVGITKPAVPEKVKLLDAWLAAGCHGTMKWMNDRAAMRRDIRLLFPAVKAIVCVGHNYYVPDEAHTGPAEVRVARYARGRDYHTVMKKKLKSLLAQLKKIYPGLEGKICVDSAPLMEKIWAEAEGLGWQGKNTVLISPRLGSWFFLGEILLNAELIPDQPLPDRCGACEACLTACPTGALIQPYLLDARRCISYLTIENRSDRLPAEYARSAGSWIFGCDLCQEACPWNRFSEATDESGYRSSRSPADMTLTRLLNLGEADFKQLFRNSPVLHTGYKNFIRNLQNAQENIPCAP